ncbi:MAG: hypothetical protein GY774_35535 [Planctomycetes bacterium]|nr:hypothetical protein [Planctomycetota bacterium]
MVAANIPIELLHKAFKILESQGMTAFRRYVVRVKMPGNDIEAVINKFNIKQDPKKAVKMKLEMAKIERKMRGMGE